MLSIPLFIGKIANFDAEAFVKGDYRVWNIENTALNYTTEELRKEMNEENPITAPEVLYCFMQGDYTTQSQFKVDGWLGHMVKGKFNLKLNTTYYNIKNGNWNWRKFKRISYYR